MLHNPDWRKLYNRRDPAPGPLRLKSGAKDVELVIDAPKYNPVIHVP
jgi:hypothetical protein